MNATSATDAERVAELVRNLASNDTGSDTARLDLAQTFRQLKELTRVTANATALYTPDGIRVLLRYASDYSEDSTSHLEDARRCLANALTLNDECVSYFLDGQGISKIVTASIAQNVSYEDEFILSRILFLVTAKAGPASNAHLVSHKMSADSLASLLDKWLARHLSAVKHEVEVFTRDSIAAFCELLKLLYNVTIFLPVVSYKIEILKSATDFVGLERAMLATIRVLQAKKLLDVIQVIPHCVNLLTLLPLKPVNFEPKSLNVSLLIALLEEYIDCLLDQVPWYGIEVNDGLLAPLLTVISRVRDLVDEGQIQAQLHEALIVQDTERSLPLGRSGSLASKVLRVLNSSSQNIRDCIGTLLYQISDSSPQKFIENIGYGFAVGFLTTHGLAIPPSQIPCSHNGIDINPITGQHSTDEAAARAQQELTDMSEEEKEKEAEKLFVLFQRLKKNGVIDVKDPIQDAVDSGRFQELRS